MWFENGKFYGFGVARGDLDYLFESSIVSFALPGCLTSSYIDVLGCVLLVSFLFLALIYSLETNGLCRLGLGSIDSFLSIFVSATFVLDMSF